MFPQHHPDSYHPAYDFSPPSITWLVGPIDCETCDGGGNAQVYGRNSPPCPACNGLGYPPTIEIISLRKVSEISTNYKVHGVMKLGKPVPIVGVFDEILPGEELTIGIDGRLWRNSNCDNDVTDQIGPCEPGQVAYPVEVVS
jgi:hypothetical protein